MEFGFPYSFRNLIIGTMRTRWLANNFVMWQKPLLLLFSFLCLWLFRWRHQTKTLRALNHKHAEHIHLQHTQLSATRTRQTCVNCVNVKIDKSDDSLVCLIMVAGCRRFVDAVCSCRSSRCRCRRCFAVFNFSSSTSAA